MIDPIENSPEDIRTMEILIDGVCKWSVSRMNLLTEQDQINNATSIYYEFAEWLDPDSENEVVIAKVAQEVHELMQGRALFNA